MERFFEGRGSIFMPLLSPEVLQRRPSLFTPPRRAVGTTPTYADRINKPGERCAMPRAHFGLQMVGFESTGAALCQFQRSPERDAHPERAQASHTTPLPTPTGWQEARNNTR